LEERSITAAVEVEKSFRICIRPVGLRSVTDNTGVARDGGVSEATGVAASDSASHASGSDAVTGVVVDDVFSTIEVDTKNGQILKNLDAEIGGLEVDSDLLISPDASGSEGIVGLDESFLTEKGSDCDVSSDIDSDGCTNISDLVAIEDVMFLVGHEHHQDFNVARRRG